MSRGPTSSAHAHHVLHPPRTAEKRFSSAHHLRPAVPNGPFCRFLADAATDPAQTFGPGVILPGAPPCATRSSVPPLLDPKRPRISPTRPPSQIPTPPPCSPAQITPLPKNLLHPRSTTPHSPRKPPSTHPNLHFFRHPTKIKNNKTNVKNHLFLKSSRNLRQGGFRPC